MPERAQTEEKPSELKRANLQEKPMRSERAMLLEKNQNRRAAPRGKGERVTESAIQRDIIAAARAMGHKAYRINSGKVKARGGWIELAEEGTPDLLIIMSRGRSLWVEVKRPSEEPTVVQRLRHRELRNLGHAVTVARSVEEFIESVREMEV